MNDTENKNLENAAPATAPEAAPETAPEADYSRARPADQPGEYSAAIPWRNMPSLPSSDPLVAGVLQGALEAGPDPESAFMGAENAACFDTAEGPGNGSIPLDEAEAWFSAEAAALGDQGQVPQQVELVLGVKFSQYGPVYFFTAGDLPAKEVQPGKMVLVDTEQGVALAEVVTARRLRLPLPKIRTEEGLEVEIKPLRGLAGPADIAAAADNRILAAGARMFCKGCIRELNLDMKLVEVEVLHDRSKIIFYFTAPTRIDFRELVKELVRNYHTRIELRQIGVRHETQMIGALGNCGMTCCCRRYLRKFAPVTIKMAKEQNLFLNPAKLSGMCGRLLCCLSYEQENYDEFHKRSPKIGKKYQTDNGIVKVMRANLFRQSIFVMDEANQESEYQLEEWEALHPLRYDQPGSPEGERRNERPERPERAERQERPERPERQERQERAGRNEKNRRREAEAAQDLPGEPAGEIRPDFDDQAGDSAGKSGQEVFSPEALAPKTPAPEAFASEALAPDESSGQDGRIDTPAVAGTVVFASVSLSVSSTDSDDADEEDEAEGGDKSIFGLPGTRYGAAAGGRQRPKGPQRPAGGRRNEHKPGNRHKPSKKGRNPE